MKNNSNQPKGLLIFFIILFALLFLLRFNLAGPSGSLVDGVKSETQSARPQKVEQVVQIPYSEGISIIEDQSLKVKELQLVNGVDKAALVTQRGQIKVFDIPEGSKDKLAQLATDNGLTVSVSQRKQPIIESILQWIFPLFLLFIMVSFIANARRGGMPGGLGGFMQSNASRISSENVKIKFDDVAGVDEAKKELQEVVQFLKNPESVRAIGAKIPKGVLLVGPPGTGKTLLAKAVAGEAGVPFFSISGSEFVELFVGVGASRVRDLFARAKQEKPAIIFIDEVDGVARSRGGNVAGGNTEQEQTLNQLLKEMDGFGDDSEGLIIIAATNRPEVLDPAMLRPGRFDRQVLVDRTNASGRAAILKIHARGKKLSPTLDLDAFAARCFGATGADLANLMNEAAIFAWRRIDKFRSENPEIVESQVPDDHITAEDMSNAWNRIIGGVKSNKSENSELLKLIAVHELGHSVAAHVTRHGKFVKGVSVVPRSKSLGHTLTSHDEDKLLYTKGEIWAELICLMAGRAASEVLMDSIDTGPGNDYEVAWNLATNAVTKWGMSELGPISIKSSQYKQYLGGSDSALPDVNGVFGDRVLENILRIVDNALTRAKEIVEEYREFILETADVLLAKEDIGAEEWSRICEEGGIPLHELDTTELSAQSLEA